MFFSPRTSQHLTTAAITLFVYGMITVAANGSAIAQGGDAGETNGKMNFLIFVADDLDKEYYGCYGNEKTASPTVTKLAQQGMVFDNAFTGMAICSPSRSMLYTGKYPLRNGAFKNHSAIYKGSKTVCHHLKALGYDVILCGKSHVNPKSAFPWTVAMHNQEPAGDPAMFTKPAMPLDQLENYFADAAPGAQRPFCVMATSYYPHGEHPQKTNFNTDAISLAPFQKDTPAIREMEARFSQAVNNSDQEFKQALALLEKYDLADNTVVIYASDHGRFGKFTVYDRGLNVPFVVRWPGVVKPGTRSDALVSFIDVLPTMIDAAGGSPSEVFDGKSLVPLLKGETDSHHRYVYGVMTNQGIINAHVFPGRMIRSKKYKYIRNYNAMEVVARKEKEGVQWIEFLKMGAQQHPDTPEEELFDMINDPFEKNNLADDASLSPVKMELKEKLQRWLESQNDFLKTPDAMPFITSQKPYRLDQLSHPRNKVDLQPELKNALDDYKFYEHKNE